MAFLEMKKGSYISRIWFFAKKGFGFDILMTLTRELPEGLWVFNYRFRYYEDDKAHDSADRRNFYKASFSEPMTEEAAVEKMGLAIAHFSEMLDCQPDVTIVQSDDPQVAVALMRGKPYFHMKYEAVES